MDKCAPTLLMCVLIVLSMKVQAQDMTGATIQNTEQPGGLSEATTSRMTEPDQATEAVDESTKEEVTTDANSMNTMDPVSDSTKLLPVTSSSSQDVTSLVGTTEESSIAQTTVSTLDQSLTTSHSGNVDSGENMTTDPVKDSPSTLAPENLDSTSDMPENASVESTNTANSNQLSTEETNEHATSTTFMQETSENPTIAETTDDAATVTDQSMTDENSNITSPPDLPITNDMTSFSDVTLDSTTTSMESISDVTVDMTTQNMTSLSDMTEDAMGQVTNFSSDVTTDTITENNTSDSDSTHVTNPSVTEIEISKFPSTIGSVESSTSVDTTPSEVTEAMPELVTTELHFKGDCESLADPDLKELFISEVKSLIATKFNIDLNQIEIHDIKCGSVYFNVTFSGVSVSDVNNLLAELLNSNSSIQITNETDYHFEDFTIFQTNVEVSTSTGVSELSTASMESTAIQTMDLEFTFRFSGDCDILLPTVEDESKDITVTPGESAQHTITSQTALSTGITLSEPTESTSETVNVSSSSEVKSTETPTHATETEEEPFVTTESSQDSVTTAVHTMSGATTVTDPNQQDITEIITNQPDITESSTNQLDITESSTNQPDIIESSTNQPDITKSSTNQLDIKESSTNQPDITESSTNQPDITESITNQPDITESSTDPSDIMKSSTDQADVTESSTNQPDVTESTTALESAEMITASTVNLESQEKSSPQNHVTPDSGFMKTSFNSLYANLSTAQQFRHTLSDALTQALNVSQYDVFVSNVSCGSVLINITLLDQSNDMLESTVMALPNQPQKLTITVEDDMGKLHTYTLEQVQSHQVALQEATTPKVIVEEDDGLTEVELIVIIVCGVIGGAFLLFILVFIIYKCLSKRKWKSFSLGESAAQMDLEDFTLTKMTRPNPVYTDQGVSYTNRPKQAPAHSNPIYHSNNGHFDNYNTPSASGANSAMRSSKENLVPGSGRPHMVSGVENPSFASDDLLDSGSNTSTELPYDNKVETNVLGESSRMI